MAEPSNSQISVTDVTSNSISVTLTNLQSTFNGTRDAAWTIRPPGTTRRNNGFTAPTGIGGGVTFSNLDSSTTYTITCLITTHYTGGGGGEYYPSNDGVSVTTLEPEKTRPSNWSWTYVGVGHDLSFPASEWNNFTDRINEFRAYKDMSSYSFTVARAGMDITNAIINQAVTAINAMSPPTRASSAVVRVTDYNAAYFNSLARALNSIT